MQDCVAKGRIGHPQGSKHGAAKLTETDVIDIRLLVEEGMLNHREIAERKGVSRVLITRIVNRQLWTHI